MPAWAALLLLGGCAVHEARLENAAALKVAPIPDTRLLMIDNARSMLGQPYVYGGAAPGGFDCSGLVQYAAAGAGVRVPRTAHEQAAVGTEISRRDLQAGDLVFMHLMRKELHVGIALDSTHFIHAPSSGGHVRIDALDAAPYAHGFIAARRIIQDR